MMVILLLIVMIGIVMEQMVMQIHHVKVLMVVVLDHVLNMDV